jgi:hypothetical protein
MENFDTAQQALAMLKAAILAELEHGPLSNADLVHRLGLESDFEGKNKNYLSWSILGMLVGEGTVAYRGTRLDRVYYLRAQAGTAEGGQR